jgi:hypothetical protein
MHEEAYRCPQCGNRIVIPAEMNESARVELADFLRLSHSRIESMTKLMHSFGVGLREAKVTVTHITDTKGTCVQCRGRLLEGGITNCPSCSALNLNW